jgi:hypothetical protein
MLVNIVVKLFTNGLTISLKADWYSELSLLSISLSINL